MSKPEVCEYLGKSKRTVETFISKGRLGVGYFQGPNGKTAVFNRSEVEALKLDIDTPMYRAVPADTAIPGSMALVPAPADQRTDPISDAILLSLLRGVPAAQPTMPGPFVGLADAVAISGMPASWLLAQARAGVPWAVNVGTGKKAFWRFSIARGAAK